MSPEHQPKTGHSPEQSRADIETAARERLETLAQTKPEAAAEHAGQRAAEAREIIHRQEAEPDPAPAETQTTPRPSFTAHLNRALNYQHTLASLQRRLSPAKRSFSKVIHTPAIEKTSEVLEQTVMRPSIVVGAVWTAAIVGSIFYITARSYGFQLSGTEMLLALVGGGILGAIIEMTVRASRKRH